MKSTEKYRWIPLESNPSIFNDYFHQIGLKDTFTFNESEFLARSHAFVLVSDKEKVVSLLLT